MKEQTFKVQVERDDCTSCANCWTLCPEVFEQNIADDKSQIIEEYRVNDNLREGIVPIEISRVNDAADQCPVQIIHVEKSTE